MLSLVRLGLRHAQSEKGHRGTTSSLSSWASPLLHGKRGQLPLYSPVFPLSVTGRFRAVHGTSGEADVSGGLKGEKDAMEKTRMPMTEGSGELYLKTLTKRLSQMTKLKKFQEAESLFSRVKKKKEAELNLIVYNCMVNCYSKGGHEAKMLGLVEEMKQIGIEPDAFTYGILMNTFSVKKDLSTVEKYFEEMKLKIKPGIIHYNSILKACGASGNLKKLQEYHEELQRNGVEEDMTTFNTIIDAYGKSGELRAMEASFDEMVEKGVRPGVYTFNTMLSAFGKNEEIDILKECYADMLERRLKPDIITYNTLIAAYWQAKLFEELESTFKELQDNKEVTPNERTFNFMINTYAYNLNLKKTVAIYEEMEKNGFVVDKEAHGKIILAHARAGNWDGAFDWLARAAKKSKVEPMTCTLLVQTCGQESQLGMIPRLRGELEKLKLTNKDFYSFMVDTYARASKFKEAAGVLAEIKEIYGGWTQKSVLVFLQSWGMDHVLPPNMEDALLKIASLGESTPLDKHTEALFADFLSQLDSDPLPQK